MPSEAVGMRAEGATLSERPSVAKATTRALLCATTRRVSSTPTQSTGSSGGGAGAAGARVCWGDRAEPGEPPGEGTGRVGGSS